ncbi:MAG: ABC transporter ATP-binding protein [Thermotogota bacterium]
MENNLIYTKKISFSYERQKVLENININIEKNKITSIYGPSGSGKTTLLFLIAGLLKGYKGEIFYREKLNKGFLFQKNNLLKDLNVIDNIKIAQLIRNFDDDIKINKIMKDLNVFELKKRFPYQLSTGEEQRIAFIKNIISNDLIFFDEPTSSLDSKNAEQMINIIKKYSINKTFIIATHDERIKDISNIIFYLKDGKITIIKR